MPGTDSTAERQAKRAAFVHRELLQLVVLMLGAVAAFFVTRALAASNRSMSLQDAAEWYRRGQQALAQKQVDRAIEDFRRAMVRNRTNSAYVLAFARALASNHDDQAAHSVLVALRESAPEDADINLELARLAARQQDVTEALRFYHNALYAPWPTELADARRGVRIELIRLLLGHHQPGRAVSELLALAADLPDDVPTHVQVGQLFAEAGDDTHALDQFQRALRLVPTDGAALAGAGQRAFALGQYSLARDYLRRAPADLGDVAGTREVVELFLSADALATRIGSAERRRRLVSDLEYLGQRLTTCLAQRAGGVATHEETRLLADTGEFAKRVRSSRVVDQDTVESGVDLMDRIGRRVAQDCGPATARDRALALVGRRRGSEIK